MTTKTKTPVPLGMIKLKAFGRSYVGTTPDGTYAFQLLVPHDTSLGISFYVFFFSDPSILERRIAGEKGLQADQVCALRLKEGINGPIISGALVDKENKKVTLVAFRDPVIPDPNVDKILIINEGVRKKAPNEVIRTPF